MFTALAMAGTSCADFDPLEFQVEEPESIARQQEINAYDSLKSYISLENSPGFKLGASGSTADILNKGVMYRLLKSNFDEITLNTAMTHGSVVQSDGDLALANLLDLYEAAEQSEMGIYGRTILWNQNQNATYLNGLLAPLIVNSPPFANSLDVSSLKNGDLDGWTYSAGGGSVTIAEQEGMGGAESAIKMTSSSNASDPADLRLTSPDIPVTPGKEYEILIYIKSDVPGEGSISFEGLVDNEPLKDWMQTGTETETFATNLSWREIRFTVNDFEGEAFKINFDLGYAPGVTYNIDINNLYVYDLDGEPIINNLISNGDFENGVAWGGWGNGSTRGVTEDGEGVGNSGRAFTVTNPSLANFWAAQSIYELGSPLNNGETYNLSFWVKGDAEGIIRPEMQSPDFSSNGFGMVPVTTEWRLVNLSTTITADDRNRFIISYGEFEGTVYIDDVVLSSATLVGGTTTVVDRLPEEKTAIVEEQLEKWVSGMVEYSAPYVNAWDVVSQPMDDNNPNELKTGVGRSLANGEFYWQDYLGKDYALKAFHLAEEYGNPSDLLFISDNNLASNLDKCRGLIQYVEYLEDNGAKIDGIGAQLNIEIFTSKENIAQMFELLAATGKKIKVTELEVRINTTQVTEEIMNQQADMYQYVLDTYREKVPASQRYGVTVWGVMDSQTNTSWGQGLWDSNLNRKPAYVGFAEGLKGL
ncbi:Carbohydrate binding domain-containing protein [Cyclobacterium lianum]|uniref:endo-1,4-beta-xylanase n=2 Tax=Cyclobacterium lianum TaxID=388280 RepID=A0A1M7QD54_9BACT|nr:Carbohydrate binding domain-containing protein [Cyclobacterium lianum]